jgi:hypothetical protein
MGRLMPLEVVALMLRVVEEEEEEVVQPRQQVVVVVVAVGVVGVVVQLRRQVEVAVVVVEEPLMPTEETVVAGQQWFLLTCPVEAERVSSWIRWVAPEQEEALPSVASGQGQGWLTGVQGLVRDRLEGQACFPCSAVVGRALFSALRSRDPRERSDDASYLQALRVSGGIHPGRYLADCAEAMPIQHACEGCQKTPRDRQQIGGLAWTMPGVVEVEAPWWPKSSSPWRCRRCWRDGAYRKQMLWPCAWMWACLSPSRHRTRRHHRLPHHHHVLKMWTCDATCHLWCGPLKCQRA